jgi:hypothetical protein
VTGSSFYWSILLLSIPVTCIGFWWAGMRAKEAAVKLARQACKRESVQLLDQTVALKTQRPARDSKGQFCWRREYQFEFASHDEFRDRAQLEMLGLRARRIVFPFQRDTEGNRIYQH